MSPKQQSEFTLIKDPEVEEIMKLFERMIGRKPTAEERADCQAMWDAKKAQQEPANG